MRLEIDGELIRSFLKTNRNRETELLQKNRVTDYINKKCFRTQKRPQIDQMLRYECRSL